MVPRGGESDEGRSYGKYRRGLVKKDLTGLLRRRRPGGINAASRAALIDAMKASLMEAKSLSLRECRWGLPPALKGDGAVAVELKIKKALIPENFGKSLNS